MSFKVILFVFVSVIMQYLPAAEHQELTVTTIFAQYPTIDIFAEDILSTCPICLDQLAGSNNELFALYACRRCYPKKDDNGIKRICACPARYHPDCIKKIFVKTKVYCPLCRACVSKYSRARKAWKFILSTCRWVVDSSNLWDIYPWS